MTVEILDSKFPSGPVLLTLARHLPHSLPLLRRLQFMQINGGQTPDSHVLSSSERELQLDEFVVAYVDFSRGPETEMWLYSSFENRECPAKETVCEEQILELFKRVRGIEQTFIRQHETSGVVLVGSLHERVLRILQKHSLVREKTGEHFKFIFRMKDLPIDVPLPGRDLSWSSIGLSDIPLVLSRTAIPRKERTVKLLPSVAITSSVRDPIAWGFLGPDGSLTSLHCEEEYRGRGLAKAVALKLFRERVTDFAHDGLSHADVATENLQSQGVCKSLKGTVGWSVYWAWVDIS